MSETLDRVLTQGVSPRLRRAAWAAALLVPACVGAALYAPRGGSVGSGEHAVSGRSPLDRLLNAVEAAREAQKPDEATALLRAAGERLHDDAGVSPQDRLRFFDVGADVNADLRRFPDAVAALEQAIALAGTLYGVDHREVAYRYERMSLVYEKMAQPNAALLSREKALRMAEKDPTVSRDTLALKFNNLGELYRRRADFARADDAYRTALSLMIAKRGASAPETAFPLNNLGLSALAQGNFDTAESYLQRAAGLPVTEATRKRIEANRKAVADARRNGVPAALKPPAEDEGEPE